MKVFTFDQRSDEWRQARCGLLTASVMGDMLATVKTPGKEAAARRDLKLRLVCERLTGQPQERSFQSDDMRHGVDVEPFGITAYEARTKRFVEPVGFVAHDELLVGCSPDGCIGEWEGGLEVKCPKTATHIGYLKAGKVPSEYEGQCLTGLWLTGAQWWDFASFDDRLPAALQLFVVRMYRDEAAIAAHELRVRQFLREVEAEYEALAKMAQEAA